MLWHKGKSIPLKNAAGLKVAFLSAMKSAKCNLRLSAMSWRTRGRSTKLKKRWAIVTFRFDANRRVAAYIACGLHLSGLVKYKTSSQLESAGMILNAFGTLPVVYLVKSSPTCL